MDIIVDFDSNDYIICNGVKLDISRNMICDLQDIGYDPINFIKKEYIKKIIITRETKIKKILEKYA